MTNSKGQAVIEYVLLLLVVVIVLVSMLLALADGTERFARNYFGDYFQCLLELGELPSLGSDGVPETECDDLYEPFTFAGGRALAGNASGGGGSGGTTGSPGPGSDSPDTVSESRGGGDSQTGAGAASQGASASAGAYDGSSARGQSDVFAQMGGRRRTVPLSQAERGGGDSDDPLDGMSSGTNNFEVGSGAEGSRAGRSRYVPIYGTMDREDEKEGDNATVKAQVDADPEQALRGKRVPVSVGKAQGADIEEGDEFTFGNFIKILIIVAIIVIIFVFFGGQVLQYSKSQE